MTDVFFSIDTAESWKHESGEGAAAVAPADVLDSTGVVDDFEDGDIAEYGGDTSAFTTQSTTVYEGSNALEAEEISQGTVVIESSSGLPRYPEAGDVYQTRKRVEDTDVAAWTYFGYQNANDWYRATLDTNFGGVKLQKSVSGSLSNLTTQNFSVTQSEWYRYEIGWGAGGTITVTVYDSGDSQVAQVSATDTSFTSGSIAWGFTGIADTARYAYWDIAEIVPSTGVVDDFEDGDIAEYGGDNSQFEVQTSVAIEGTYSLRGFTNTSNEGFTITSVDGLVRYPEQGDVFQSRIRAGTGVDARTWFGVQTETNGNPDGYAINFSIKGDELALEGWSSGNRTFLGTASSLGLSENQNYRIKTEWTGSGDITVTLYDDSDNQVASVSGTDTTYASGGIGFRIFEGGGTGASDMYADLYEIV